MSWETVKLGDLCEFVRGLTYSKSDEIDLSNNVVLRANNINLSTYKLDFEELKYIKDSIVVRDDKKLRRNDILICTASGSKSHLGKVALIEEDLNMAFGGFMGVLRTKSNSINPKYLFKLLSSSFFVNHVQSLSDGANINNLKFSQIQDFQIPLPPLPVQQKIVEKLDAIFAEIDKAVAATEANIKNLSKILDSYFEDIFNNQSIKFVSCKLGDFCETTQGVQISKQYQLNTPKDGYRRYLYISDFETDKNLKYVLDNNPKKVVTPNDLIVVNTGATAGKVFWGIDGVLSNNLFRVTHNDKIDKNYLYYFITSNIFKTYQKLNVRGAANPHMGHENFNATPILVPDLNTQRLFVKHLEIVDDKTNKAKFLLMMKIKNLTSLRQIILKQAFNGELVKE